VVYDTENRMLGSRTMSALTKLVLPAPEGAATTYNRPDSGDVSMSNYPCFRGCSRRRARSRDEIAST